MRVKHVTHVSEKYLCIYFVIFVFMKVSYAPVRVVRAKRQSVKEISQLSLHFLFSVINNPFLGI